MTGYQSKKAAARDKLAQPAQEPVAWCSQCGHKCPLPAQEPVATLFGTLPVYETAPPQRPWVGLTEQEFQLIYDMGRTPSGMMEMVESMLKDKNT